MNITVAATSGIVSKTWDLVSCVMFEDDAPNAKVLKHLPKDVKRKIEIAQSLKDFTGKKDESLFFYTEGTMPAPRMFIAGAGQSERYTLEHLRRNAAIAIKKAKSCRARSAAFIIPSGVTSLGAYSAEDLAQAVTEAILLALYAFDRHKTKDKKPITLRSVALLIDGEGRKPAFERGIASGIVIAQATLHVRDLANSSGGDLFPAALADDARRTARSGGFRAEILTRPAIERLGMGGVIGVGKGSAHDPRFIILDYKPRTARRTIVLVGKGVTFDSGGISIKPSAGMSEMRMDMHGGATVIGTLEAASRLKLPVRIVGLIPSVENMPSGSAMKPGDIVTHYNGMTSEVDNTDAEGRLILADALSYASRYAPDVIIDIATLTGAAVVALGHHATGMLGTDDATMQALKTAGDKTYERVWQLPLFDEYDKQIRSDVADVKNVGGRWGGAITAAAFLKNFVGAHNWVHLDIAGTSYLEEAYDYIPKGATGVGVRLLVEYLRALPAR